MRSQLLAITLFVCALCFNGEAKAERLFVCAFTAFVVNFQTFDLTNLNREQCNLLLLQHGFYKKASQEEEVPEEFADGPSNARVDL